MLPLAVWMALTCSELKEAEIRYAVREVQLLDRLQDPKTAAWVRDSLESEYLLTRAELGQIDDAKEAKGCP